MNKLIGKFDHLVNNLERIHSENSILKYNQGNKAFPSLVKGDLNKWLEELLPNTRLIIEPRIIGLCVGIQYIDGKINKVIDKNYKDITEEIKSIKSIPILLPIKKSIEIYGVIFDIKYSAKKQKSNFIKTRKVSMTKKNLSFCAFHIFHCNLNQFQSLKELKKLNFEIPDTYFTKYTSDIKIYYQCWIENKLFQNYPNNGLVLKINSRKLQKLCGQNKHYLNWAYEIH